MSAAEKIPFEFRWLSAEQVGELLGREVRYVLERLAPLPDFPKADRRGHPRWLAGEVMRWQEANRASQQARPRRRRSTAKGFANPDDR